MKCKQPRLVFVLRSTSPLPTTIAITPRRILNVYMYVCKYVCPPRKVTVTYVKNYAILLLVSKAICVNVQNPSCTQKMSLRAKLNGCAHSVAKSVAAWLPWRVIYEHTQFRAWWGRGKRGHEIREVVMLETERTAIMYVRMCVYIYPMHTPRARCYTMSTFKRSFLLPVLVVI